MLRFRHQGNRPLAGLPGRSVSLLSSLCRRHAARGGLAAAETRQRTERRGAIVS